MSTLAVMWEDVRSIPGAVPTQRRHSRVTTQDFRRDLLRHLIDYRPAGFRFARFKDEIIDVEIDGVRYECFGRCNYGVFLIADDGAVRFRSTSPAHTDDQEWFPANRELRAFVKCYSAFISSVFQVAAHFDEDTADQAERQATILEHWIRAVDVDALRCARTPTGLSGSPCWRRMTSRSHDRWSNICRPIGFLLPRRRWRAE
ncbi:hypothetical protein [Salana multivorans]